MATINSATTNFGITQIGKNTPPIVQNILIIILALVGAFMGWMNSTHYISANTQAFIGSVVMWFTPIVSLLANMFGVKLPTDVVPTNTPVQKDKALKIS